MDFKNWLRRYQSVLRQRLLLDWQAIRRRKRQNTRRSSECLEGRLLLTAPVANDDSDSVAHNSTLYSTLGVLDNDYPGNSGGSGGGSLQAILQSGPAHGSLTLNSDGTFAYTPTTQWAGTDSFTYQAYDGAQYSNTATVTIVVTNNTPAAQNDHYTVYKDFNDSNSDGLATLFDNDFDVDSDSLTASLASGASHGSVTVNSNGTFVYTPDSGYTGTDAFTYTVSDGMATSSAATVTLTVSKPFGSQTNSTATPMADPMNYGQYSTSTQTGDLIVGQSVAPEHDLVYSELSANPNPVVTVNTTFQTGAPVPDLIQAELTVGSVSSGVVYYNTAGLYGGAGLSFGLTVNGSSLTTGRYSYSLVLTAVYGAVTGTRTFSGNVNIVNGGDSEFGEGWGLAEVDRLVAGSGGMMYVTGLGLSAWFASGSSGTFTSPAGPLAASTLVQNVDGTYTLTSRTGEITEFSSYGLLVERIDRNGDTTTYAYDDEDGDSQDDELSTITDAYGRVTTFNYTSGIVSSVTDFASRTTSLTHDSSLQVTAIIQPDPDGSGSRTSPTTNYTYSSGQLTDETDPVGRSTGFAYDFAGRLSEVTNSDATTRLFAATELNSVVDTTSGVGSSSNPAALVVSSDYMYVSTNELGHENLYATDVFGYTTSSTDPLGNTTSYSRNSNGQVTAVTTAPIFGASTVTSYAYDSSGNLTQITYADSTTESWTYDGSVNKPLSHTTPLGTTDYTYDSYGNVLTVTDDLGNITTYTYNSHGLKTSMTLPDPDGAGSLTSPVYEYIYDNYGRLIEITNPNSTTRTFGYDIADNLTSVTDELGNETTYTYDTLGWMLTVTGADPDGSGSLSAPITAYWYDAAGRVTSITDANGGVTTFVYNDRDQLTSVTSPDPDNTGPLSSPVNSWSYDNAGRKTSAIDANGNVTTYAYDNANQLTSVTSPDPDGSGPLTATTTTYAYDTRGRLMCTMDPLSHTTAYTYDSRGRIAASTDALGGSISYTYDFAGNMTSATASDPDGNGPLAAPVTTYTYDAIGRLTSVTDPNGNATLTEYDNLGRTISVTQPDPDGGGSLTSPVTTYLYDVMGRTISVTDPNGDKTVFGYDDAANRTSVTLPDPDGAGSLTSPVTTYSYDALKRVIGVTDPNSGVTSYTYDANNNQTSVTDPESNVTTFSYDFLNRITSDTNANNDTRTYSYDAAGNVTSTTDRNGRVINSTYDNMGRKTAELWMNGSSVINTISYVYDAASRLTSVSDNDSAYSYTYDANNRLTSTSNYGTGGVPSVILTSDYDVLGRRTTLSAEIGYTSDFVNSYHYDNAGRMTRIDQYAGASGGSGGSTTADKRIDLIYDNIGRITSLDRYADLSGSSLVASTDYAYDDAGHLTSLDHAQGTTSLASYTWTYDTNGRITVATSTDGTNNYSYDADGQLTSASLISESYSYDSTGNRTNTGYSTGDNNELLSDGTYNYQYDAEGNRTRKTEISSGDYVTYTWDFRNRLTTVSYFTASDVLTRSVEYTYDVNNLQITRSVDDDGDSTIDRGEAFVYDGPNVAVVFDESGTLEHRYMQGPAIDQVFADETGSGQVYWDLTDNQGSIRDVIEYNSSTGVTSVVNHIQYDAFGNIVSQTDSTKEPGQTYTGHQWDSDAQLYYYRARWYDSSTGRFISTDPSGFAAGDVNLYRYVTNGPTNATDPTGLYEQSIYNPTDPLFSDPGFSNPFTPQVTTRLPLILSEPMTELPPAFDPSVFPISDPIQKLLNQYPPSPPDFSPPKPEIPDYRDYPVKPPTLLNPPMMPLPNWYPRPFGIDIIPFPDPGGGGIIWVRPSSV